MQTGFFVFTFAIQIIQKQKSENMGDAPNVIDVLSGKESVKVKHEITIAPAVIISVIIGTLLIAILKYATR